MIMTLLYLGIIVLVSNTFDRSVVNTIELKLTTCLWKLYRDADMSVTMNV